MPIPAQTPEANYTADGIATSYAYAFRIFAATDLVVTVAGAVKILNVDYTVSGVNSPSGGSVVFTAPPAASAAVKLLRSIPIDRATDYTTAGPNRAQTMDDDLDRATAQKQDMKHRLTQAETDIDNLEGRMDTAEQDIDTTAAGLAQEITDRQAAVASEAASREAADDAEATARQAADNAEAAARIAQDNALAQQIGSIWIGSLTAGDVSVGNYAALRAMTPPASGNGTAILQGRTTAGDGGGGVFRWASGDQSANVTADPQSGIYVAPNTDLTGAGGAWVRQYSWAVDVKWFGAKGDGGTDDTAIIQSAIGFCTTNGKTLIVPGGPYLITTIQVTCKILGTVNNRFASGDCTFTSAVGSGVYAVAITNYGGQLENVTIRNTGGGNGINCQLAGTTTVLKDVSTSTTFTRVTGSGSIGVNFGSDAVPGQQAITGTYDVVNSRDYDVCFRMRYYSNSNTYKQLYALATNNAEQPATAGFLVNGRGATFISCNAESNFLFMLNEQAGAGGAEENTYINFWAEGISGTQIALNGTGSMMINPYGFVGGTGGSVTIPITKSAYATVLKRRGPSRGDNIENFSAQGGNLVRNAEIVNGLGGLDWGSFAVPSGNTLFGYKSLSIQNSGPATSVTADHLMSYIDLNVHSWLRGKTITMMCFGVAESGVAMSIRGIVRTAGGSNLQYATSETFPTGAAEIRVISFNIPTVVADARYIVFRISASGVTSGTPSKAGEIALPMVYLGNRINDIAPRIVTDGSNTFYGDQTVYGGAWNSGHIVLGSHHIWVDSAGKLRIKSSAPVSDTDGTVVGVQS